MTDGATGGVVIALAAIVPLVALMLTSFVKVSVVLALLRNAIGAHDAPSGLVVMGVSLVLTFFVMAPVGVDMIRAAGAGSDVPSGAAPTSPRPAPGTPGRPTAPRDASGAPKETPGAGRRAPADASGAPEETPGAGRRVPADASEGAPRDPAATPAGGSEGAPRDPAATPADASAPAVSGTRPGASAGALADADASAPAASGTRPGASAGAPASADASAGTTAKDAFAGASAKDASSETPPLVRLELERAVRDVVPVRYHAQVDAAARAIGPLRGFLARHADARDRETFTRVAERMGRATNGDELWVLAPAFLATELREAFAIAVLIFVPFLVIDLVVGLGLAALGLATTQPQVVALPLKLLLFVAVDGWRLLLDALLRGYA